MLEKLVHHIPEFERLLLENFQFILDRNERRPDYKFIDTKVRIIDGIEFPDEAAGTIYGREVVYAFVQGRGLESVAEHLRWIRGLSIANGRKRKIEKRCLSILRDVTAGVERLRHRNHGHVRFMMNVDGTALRVGQNQRIFPLDDGVVSPNLNDVFVAKGLFAAAGVLGAGATRVEAEGYLKKTVKAAFTDDFIIDKQVMDPKNQVGTEPGTKGHGPLMISLGGIALALAGSDDPEWADLAEEAVEKIMFNYLNTGQFSDLRRLDFFELADAGGRPWRGAEGVVVCDPGHCLEFIGLACETLKALPGGSGLWARCAEIFPELFVHIFDLGFNADAGGLCKAYDLISRKVVNSDMPWWNLPETMRAAASLLELFPSVRDDDIRERFELARSAFFDNYLNPDLYRLAYQTRAADGSVVDVIPAVPDADPCYHTGLSLIGVLGAFERTGQSSL